MNMKLHLLIWWYQYWCFNIFLFDQLPSFLTFLCPKKSLCFYGQFNNRCHNSSNVFYETFVKLCHTMNAHLPIFKLMPYPLHFWKHNMSFCEWLSISLYIVKSSKNIFIKLSKYYLNALVTTLWYVGSSFLTPNDITFTTTHLGFCNYVLIKKDICN